MKTNHTPGKWYIAAESTIIVSSGGSEICSITPQGKNWQEEDQANAALIAASPCLLAALQDIESIANGTAPDFTPDQRKDERFCIGAIIGAARKAIRAATGEA